MVVFDHIKSALKSSRGYKINPCLLSFSREKTIGVVQALPPDNHPEPERKLLKP
jgi:hypothetical protein